jgi:hypothetical protein
VKNKPATLERHSTLPRAALKPVSALAQRRKQCLPTQSLPGGVSAPRGRS